ncbi:hypothetical protein ScPMuIL_000026 [Solemya velum]
MAPGAYRQGATSALVTISRTYYEASHTMSPTLGPTQRIQTTPISPTLKHNRRNDVNELLDDYRGNVTAIGTLLSDVMSVNAFMNGRSHSIKHNFRLQHRHGSIVRDEDASVLRPTCAFFLNDSSMWNTYGCVVINSTSEATECFCNHTTNFAILMQIVDVEIAEVHRLVLGIITYVGCGISILTSLMAITVFTCIRSLNSERIFVHRNLCTAITAAQVLFLLGVEAVDYKILCSGIALLLHYLYTSVFMWTLVEGIHLYTQVVQVFGTDKARLNYYLVCGWGIPILLVAISAVTDWDGYGTETSCWLSIRRRTIWAFVGPACSVMIVNVIILVMVVRVVVSTSREINQSKHGYIRAAVKANVFLLPLLGLSWVFGLLTVNQDLVFFQYMFAIFNSLQGLFIFLFNGVLNTEVRQAIRRIQEKRAIEKDSHLSCHRESITSADDRKEWCKRTISHINETPTTTSTSAESHGSIKLSPSPDYPPCTKIREIQGGSKDTRVFPQQYRRQSMLFCNRRKTSLHNSCMVDVRTKPLTNPRQHVLNACTDMAITSSTQNSSVALSRGQTRRTTTRVAPVECDDCAFI